MGLIVDMPSCSTNLGFYYNNNNNNWIGMLIINEFGRIGTDMPGK